MMWKFDFLNNFVSLYFTRTQIMWQIAFAAAGIERTQAKISESQTL